MFEIARGGSPRPIDRFVTDDATGVNWITISDAKEGSKYIASTRRRIIADGVSRSRMVKPGDFLLTNSMSFGHPYIVKTTGCIHDGWLVLSPRDGKVHPDYFYYLLASKGVYAEFERVAAGATVKNLNIGLVEKVKVPVPPLSQQRRIADILDRADSLRGKRQLSLEYSVNMGPAVFRHHFGGSESILQHWPVKKLGGLLDFLTSGSRGWAAYYAESGDLFLRIQNVRRDELVTDDIAYVTPPQTAEAMRTRVRPGDVLLSITADLGRTAIVPESLGPAYINQHLAILRTTALVPRFLSAFLASPAGQRQIVSRNREGVKAGLNFDDIRSLLVPVPPRSLQWQFAAALGAVEHLKESLRSSSTVLNGLFAAIQHRAFRGEL